MFNEYNQNNDHHKDATKTLLKQQNNLEKNLQKVGGHSLWFTVILVFMCFPSLCHLMLYTTFSKLFTYDFKTRCRISQLEHKNWTFEQIQKLSTPREDPLNCTYFNYMYDLFSNMNYNDALMYTTMVQRPEVMTCTQYVHKRREFFSIYEEFSLVCQRKHLEGVLDIATAYGQIVAGIFLLPLADLLGRKRVINWGANLFMAGALFVCLAHSAEALIFGRIMVGIAYTSMILPMEAIIVELSNVQLRPVRFISLKLGIGLGYILMPLLAKEIQHWRHLQWTVSSLLLILPLTIWYIPESPRWFASKNKKAKAWTVLRSIRDPVTQSEMLLAYQNEKSTTRSHLMEHYKGLKPLGQRLLLLWMLFFVIEAIYFKNYLVRFRLTFHIARPVYFLLSGITEMFSYVLCIALLCTFSRKITMGIFFFVAASGYIILSEISTGTVESLVCLLIMELSIGVVYATALLCLAENVPTTHRCTATGIVYGLGGGISILTMFYVYAYLGTERTTFILLGCMCLVGMVMSCLLQELDKTTLYDTVNEMTRPHKK